MADMRFASTVLGVLVGLACAASALAQPTPSAPPSDDGLTMQAAVGKAVRWHPLLGNARARVQQAGAGIDAARAAYYPSVSVGVNSQASGNEISGYDSQYVQQAQLQVSQLLYDFGKTGSTVDRAEAEQAQAQAQVLQAFASVARNTAQAWVQVRNYEARTQVAEAQLEAVKALAKLAERREAKGASTHSDTAQAKARVDAAQLELLTAQSQVRQWRANLMHWVGSEAPPEVVGEPWPALRQACTTVTLGDVMQTATVQVAQAQLAVTSAAEDIADAQLRPTLSLDATVARGLNEQSRRYGEEIDSSIALDLSMPLYQGGRLRSTQRAAEYAVVAARAGLQQARVAANRGLQDAVVQWQRNQSLRQVQASRIDSMRITRELYRDQYLKLGTRSLLDLLNAEQEYYGALGDYVESEYAMQSLGIDCLYYAGQLRELIGDDSRATPDSMNSSDGQGSAS